MKHHLVGTKSTTLAQIPIQEKKKVGSYLVVQNPAGRLGADPWAAYFGKPQRLPAQLTELLRGG